MVSAKPGIFSERHNTFTIWWYATVISRSGSLKLIFPLHKTDIEKNSKIFSFRVESLDMSLPTLDWAEGRLRLLLTKSILMFLRLPLVSRSRGHPFGQYYWQKIYACSQVIYISPGHLTKRPPTIYYCKTNLEHYLFIFIVPVAGWFVIKSTQFNSLPLRLVSPW